MRTLCGHNKPVQKLEVRGRRLVSIAGRKIRVWCVDTLRCVRNVHTQDGGGALRALAVADRDTVYVSGQVQTLLPF